MMAAAIAVWVWGASSAPAQYSSGNFKLELYNSTGTIPLNGGTFVANQLSSGAVDPAGPTASDFFLVRVYLYQLGGSPSMNTSGMAGVGARLNYANTSGSGTPVAKVPAASSANIISGQTVNQYDIITRNGTGSTTDTTSSASITTGLFDPGDVVPLPGDNGDSGRFLIGTFKLQAQGQGGAINVTVVDPFSGTNFQVGPNPPASDGTVGGPGAGPLTNIDNFLTDYSTPPSFNSFTLTVVPEPTTLALCGFAGLGLVLRRRKKA